MLPLLTKYGIFNLATDPSVPDLLANAQNTVRLKFETLKG